MNAIPSRLRIDAYILAIVGMAVIAAILPARGGGKDVLNIVGTQPSRSCSSSTC